MHPRNLAERTEAARARIEQSAARLVAALDIEPLTIEKGHDAAHNQLFHIEFIARLLEAVADKVAQKVR